MKREELLKMVKEDGLNLCYVMNQDKEICLTAVKQNGCALKYVENQDVEICLEAVKKNIKAIEYIKDKRILNEILIYLSFLKENNLI